MVLRWPVAFPSLMETLKCLLAAVSQVQLAWVSIQYLSLSSYAGPTPLPPPHPGLVLSWVPSSLQRCPSRPPFPHPMEGAKRRPQHHQEERGPMNGRDWFSEASQYPECSKPVLTCDNTLPEPSSLHLCPPHRQSPRACTQRWREWYGPREPAWLTLSSIH